MSKATLIFPVPQGGTASFSVSVVRYQLGYQYLLTHSTVRETKHSYPIRVKEKDISLVIQCRSVDQYNNLRQAIYKAQAYTLDKVEKSPIRFSYPALGLDYLGYIPQVSFGQRRFEFAPQLSLIVVPLKDTINQISRTYSSANGTWRDLVGDDRQINVGGVIAGSAGSILDIFKPSTGAKKETTGQKRETR